MAFIANARVSILRGTYTDEYGDVHDSSRPVAVDIPASLIQMTRTVASPETGRSFDIEYVDGYVKSRVDIRKGDRVMDQATGVIYTVDAVYSSSFLVKADKRLKLRILDA